MKITGMVIGLITVLTTSGNLWAHDVKANKGYWSSADGNVLRSGSGNCWRSIHWTPELAIPECEGGKSGVAAAPKPAVPAPSAASGAAAKADESVAPATAKPAPSRAPVQAPKIVAPAVAAPSTAVPKASPVPAIPVERALPMAVMQTISLSGSALFDSGKTELKGTDIGELDQLASTMRQYPEIESVEILGHTDSRGPDALNRKLSEQRAESVRDYLIQRGVDPSRISTRGLGSGSPIASNDTASGRARNRRVEIRVAARKAAQQ